MNDVFEGNLKLIGKNTEDLKIISAYLQDSIVSVNDIVFLKKNKTFVMIVNRFMWENPGRVMYGENKRIRCAVKFEEVISVKSKNVNQTSKDKFFECLTIECSSEIEEYQEINIFFAGDSVITLTSETIEVQLNDLGKSWNVKKAPKHKI